MNPFPDPYGVLGPGEIQVKSSMRNLPDREGRLTDVIKGDVLVRSLMVMIAMLELTR